MVEQPTSRRIWDAIEPIASNVYFAPEVHLAFQEIGFDGARIGANAIQSPNMVAYFTSRGACLGPNVDGNLVASAFGVFKLSMVVDAVATGWTITDQPTVLAAREQGAAAALRRHLGDAPTDLEWATATLTRMADAAPGEGRALFSGLRSLRDPDEPMARFWLAANRVREHRGDSHIAAWVSAGLDATEIGLLTDVWRGQELKSWVRTRGWTDADLDAGCDRLRDRGYLSGDELTDAGRQLRDQIEIATDRGEERLVAALGTDADRLFAILEPWRETILDERGYPARPRWPRPS
jgi:hypothetical protein